jgi:hypothetical protein
LEGRLQGVSAATGDFSRNYQPPKQLKALQIDRLEIFNWSRSELVTKSNIVGGSKI